MTAAPLPRLRPAAPWSGEFEARSRTRATLRLRGEDGLEAVVQLERCAAGRLRDAYPAGEHDLEITVVEPGPGGVAAADVLRQISEMVWEADSRCRRIVLVVGPTDRELRVRAGEAGFRRAVDVDLPNLGTVDLFVAEPAWVTAVDMDLDRVPTR